ncbi:MAG: hypothetical protein LBL59_06425 [Xanthomonadaceae bacterium]|jgi:hypothetical protein|nr:hypothetical protein [Xanthomonadaceae bacterium]
MNQSQAGRGAGRLLRIARGIFVVVILLFVAAGLFGRMLRSHYDDFITVEDVTPRHEGKPIERVLFWNEQELERIGQASNQASTESRAVIGALESHLRACGVLLPGRLDTLSDKAIEKLTELNAWSGDARDVREAVTEQEAHYVFMTELVHIKVKGSDLQEASFRYRLFDVRESDSLLWQAKAERIPGFFSGRTPNEDKQARDVIKAMREAGWLGECGATAAN